MARIVSCLIALLVCCVVDREMYAGQYETDLYVSAEQGVGDFAGAVRNWTNHIAPRTT